jgi:hypothetical protein
MTQRKTWNDFTERQQNAIKIAAVVQIKLLTMALWDIWHRPADSIRGDRRLWTLASFVSFAGPIAYFVFGRRPSAGQNKTAG